MRMQENEGIAFENYVDIFDGGPTMTARTDQVRSIREAQDASIIAIDRDGGEEAIVATGRLGDFRTAYGRVRPVGSNIVVSPDCAQALGLGEDDPVAWVSRV
jgi:arginine N-succinyltransferase